MGNFILILFLYLFEIVISQKGQIKVSYDSEEKLFVNITFYPTSIQNLDTRNEMIHIIGKICSEYSNELILSECFHKFELYNKKWVCNLFNFKDCTS